jgi:two-component system sensor histidine kinase KdpD
MVTSELQRLKEYFAPRSKPGAYALALVAVAVCSAVCRLVQGRLDQSNLIMIYLLGVVWCAARYGRGPSVLASIASVGAFDYFFVPPFFSFTVADSQYLLTFAVMLVIAILISTLTARARELALEGSQLAQQAEFERLRNVLLSSVSHEVRTPLATITGAASGLLASERLKELPRETDLATAIYEESQRLEAYVTNVLNMTRLQSGTVQLNLEPQPLEEVVGAALARLEDRLGERNIITELPADLPLLSLDAVLMEQVFFNLLDNAAKYTVSGDTIRISAQAEGASVLITVKDSGCGIKPEDRELVFEKFFRSKDTEHSVFGAGLGLAICRAIIEAHGGKIWADASDTTHGASLVFRLPVRAIGEIKKHAD